MEKTARKTHLKSNIRSGISGFKLCSHLQGVYARGDIGWGAACTLKLTCENVQEFLLRSNGIGKGLIKNSQWKGQLRERQGNTKGCHVNEGNS